MPHFFRHLFIFVVTLSLAACGANETSETPSPEASSPSVTKVNFASKAIPKSEPSKPVGFQPACTEKITRKMPDPSAADVTYLPLSGADGYQATVKLQSQGGGEAMRFTYSCLKSADGTIKTQLISD